MAISSAGLGLAAAAVWGSADFFGGLATRRQAALRVVFVAHGLSLLALAALLPICGRGWPGAAALLIPFAGGIAGGLGLVLFYHALSLGEMGLTAAVTGLLTALVPVIFGAWTEGLPRPAQLAGFAVAAAALWLITASRGKTALRPLLLGTLAGLCFSGMMIALRTGAAHHGVLWTLTTARLASVLLTGLLLLRKNKSAPPARAWFALAALAGALDTTGNLLFTLAAVAGRLDVAGILSSLYPAGTILLAALVLREHPTARQWLGMALALLAAALVTA